MQNEIEIKLIVPSNYQKTLAFFSEIPNATLTTESFTLENIYFDTPDKQLRHWDMGLRVRRKDQHIEQTIKTAGQVIGGLHQRPEYNIDIDTTSPILALFPREIWPNDTDVTNIERELEPLFCTNFNRHCYTLTYGDDTVVEVVFDQGLIESHGRSVTIDEVELELVTGDPMRIFQLATDLSQQCPVRFGINSKAARGYLLASNSTDKTSNLAMVDIDCQDTLESAYIKSINHGLTHWQRHIEIFIEQGQYTAIKEIRHGLSLIIKTNEIYQAYLDGDRLKQLTNSVSWLIDELAFIDDYLRIEALLSNESAAFKIIEQQPLIRQLLRQRLAQLPTPESLHTLLHSAKHTQLVASLMQWIYVKPWQQQGGDRFDKFQRPFTVQRAVDILSDQWRAIERCLPLNSELTYHDYLAQGIHLQHNLHIDLCLGKLFNQQQHLAFTGPWLDISEGIDQLLAFEPIKHLLCQHQLIDDDAITKWLSLKELSLFSAMEKSRQKALQLTPYWLL